MKPAGTATDARPISWHEFIDRMKSTNGNEMPEQRKLTWNRFIRNYPEPLVTVPEGIDIHKEYSEVFWFSILKKVMNNKKAGTNKTHETGADQGQTNQHFTPLVPTAPTVDNKTGSEVNVTDQPYNKQSKAKTNIEIYGAPELSLSQTGLVMNKSFDIPKKSERRSIVPPTKAGIYGVGHDSQVHLSQTGLGGAKQNKDKSEQGDSIATDHKSSYNNMRETPLSNIGHLSKAENKVRDNGKQYGVVPPAPVYDIPVLPDDEMPDTPAHRYLYLPKV